MKICPTCRDEFLEHVTTCPTCRETLVAHLHQGLNAVPDEMAFKSDMINKESEMAVFFEGPVDRCRDIEIELKKRAISCAVLPLKINSEWDNIGAMMGPTKAAVYHVIVRKSDIPSCEKALADCFLDSVQREGKGNIVTAVVDVGDGEVTCPACGESAPLVEGACHSCGLFLGAT